MPDGRNDRVTPSTVAMIELSPALPKEVPSTI
jgi:hypothetical protein